MEICHDTEITLGIEITLDMEAKNHTHIYIYIVQTLVKNNNYAVGYINYTFTHFINCC